MLNHNNIYLIAPYRIKGLKTTNVLAAYEYCKTKTILGVDCETAPKEEWKYIDKAALDPYLANVVLFQIGDLDRQFVIDTRYVNVSIFKDILEDPSILKVGTNLKFDSKMFLSNFDWVMQNVYDVMIVDQFLHKGKYDFIRKKKKKETAAYKLFMDFINNKTREQNTGFSLAAILERRFQTQFISSNTPALFEEFSFSKEVRKNFMSAVYDPFSLVELVYGANDVWMPLVIREKQQEELHSNNQEELEKLENEFVTSLSIIEYNGCYLDTLKWMDLYAKNLNKLDAINNKLLEIEDINWASSRQVVKTFKELGIPTEILDKDKGSYDDPVYKDTVQENHIKKYAKDFPIIKTYLDFKKLSKQTGTYGEKFLDNINPVTGRIHSNYLQLMNTGRLSSQSPNMQNLPSKVPDFRECFVPTEGNALVIADYSNQEARIAACKADDEIMMDVFINGDGDLHSKVASLMFNKVVHKQLKDKDGKIIRKASNLDLRDLGKVCNFTILFGGGASRIAEVFGLSKKESQKLIDLYFKQFQKLKLYLDNQTIRALSKGYIEIDSYTNRRFYLKNYEYYSEVKRLQNKYRLSGWSFPRKLSSFIRKYEADVARIAANFPIQGTAAFMTKAAVNLFTKWILENNYRDKIKIVNIVHDEIVIECEKSLANVVASEIKRCMEAAGKLFTDKMTMVAEPKITDWWNH